MYVREGTEPAYMAGWFGLGQPRLNDATQFQSIVASIQGQLKRKFQDPKDPRLYLRQRELVKLFGLVPPSFAKTLYERLQSENPLGRLFRYRLATPMRKQLLDILLSAPSANPQKPQVGPQPPLPPPAGTKSVSEWRELADKMFINYKRQVPGRLTDVDAKELNRRITASYAAMYLSRPSVFKWAGMAAFASAEVGRGMLQAWQLGFGDWGISAGGTSLVWIGGLIKTGKSVGPMLGKKLFWTLSGGNRFVWWDIFWQHLAYREQGLVALVAAHKASELSSAVLEAWRHIDTGSQTGDAALLWQGNRELLKHEQGGVLQVQVYDRSRDIWPMISDEVPSPIPEHGVKFTDFVPGGDIGSFKDRWKWIEESMLPAWMSLETNKPAKVTSLLNALR